MDLGTDYCYAGVPLAIICNDRPTLSAQKVLQETKKKTDVVTIHAIARGKAGRKGNGQFSRRRSGTRLLRDEV